MKTKITTLLIMLASVFSLSAQIPNGSFENWTINNPDYWIHWNALYPGIVTQVSDPHGVGNKAVSLNVVSLFGSNAGGSIWSGDNANNTYFPVSPAPGALHGWYKLHKTLSTEGFTVLFGTKEMGTATGTGADIVSTSTLVYTEFIINCNYIGTPAADSAFIYIVLGNSVSSDSVRWGTNAIIDDLSFGPAVPTGVEELSNINLLESCNPNPSSQVANIIYRVTGKSKVSLALFDIVGNQVKVLLDAMDQNSGRYKIPTDVSDLADGIYFYRLDVNGQSFTQKLVVSKTNR